VHIHRACLWTLLRTRFSFFLRIYRALLRIYRVLLWMCWALLKQQDVLFHKCLCPFIGLFRGLVAGLFPGYLGSFVEV